MNLPVSILSLIPLFCLVTNAQEGPPAEAQKYHDTLLKHPHNQTLFSRFYDKWIDTNSIESLEKFLIDRANTHGGIDHIILARYQLQRGQDSNAILSLNKAVESLPNDTHLLIERGKLLMRSQNFADARKDLEAAAKSSDDSISIESHKLIGKIHLREGDPEAAIKEWEQILTKHPNNEDLLEDLVELAFSAEQVEQALKYSERLIAASSDPYKKSLRLIRRGELFAKSGENDKAIELWSDTLSKTGEGSWLEREILAHIEQTYRRQDRIDLLTSKFEELATSHPRRLFIHRELAKLEAAAGNVDSAIGRYHEVLRRSPSESELREEFIQLLISSERYEDASGELQKMLKSSPKNPELHLRLADIAFAKSEANPDKKNNDATAEILKSLKAAKELLDPTEASSLRIAHLMLRYGLNPEGENLLKELASKPDASSAPAEALASEYIRTKRTKLAADILQGLSKSPDAETVIRVTNALAPLTTQQTPFEILLSRLPEFSDNNPYITALIQSSLAAKRPADAIQPSLKLVRSSKLSSEIQDSIKLAGAVINAAEKTQNIIDELSKIESPTNPEICLLASLLETQKQHEKTDALFLSKNDPVLLRFHSSLLAVRGDFKAAITSMQKLAELSKDNSASYYKELSDLQLRSGDFNAALKTIENWKIAAPTDKTPWTIVIRLLQESGRYQDALDNNRRALSRFANDEDLTASLAELYQQIGDNMETERIFWKLYDQAPDTGSQTRWAAKLAELARNYGKTEELKEKFLLRSKSNQQSIGPILAMAELARVNQDKNSLSEYLYQALRIKPKDIDIRLQLAASEKDSGNLDKQIALLKEGSEFDSSGRIRTSLAQALIDQGQVLKGLHMLRALNGDKASDPRLVETAANSVANKGMVADAIQYLEESLPPNADWRARYLLATLLQKDGRETEAVDIYISLLDAKDEIPNLIQSSNSSHFSSIPIQTISRGRRSLSQDLDENQSKEQIFQNLISTITQELYLRQNRGYYYGNQQMALPSTTYEVRFRSIMQLAFIASLKNEKLNAKINEAKIEELPFIMDIIDNYHEGNINHLALLVKHPEKTELIRYAINSGSSIETSKDGKAHVYETLRKIGENPTLDITTRIQIYYKLIEADPKNEKSWDQITELLEKYSKDEKFSQSQVQQQIYSIVATYRTGIPDKIFAKFREIFTKDYKPDDESTILNPLPQLSLYSLFKDVDPWIKLINSSIKNHQVTANQNHETNIESWKQNRGRLLYDNYLNLRLSDNQYLPITSLPYGYLQLIKSKDELRNQQNYYGSSGNGYFLANEIIQHADKIESALFRLWIAIQSEDEKAIKKALSQKPSDLESTDFTVLKIWHKVSSDDQLEAARLLAQFCKSNPENPTVHHWANSTLFAICIDLDAEQRKEFNELLREILKAYYEPISNSNNDSSFQYKHSILVEIAKHFAFEDLHKTFNSTNFANNQSKNTTHNVRKPFTRKSGFIGSAVKINNPQNNNNNRPLTAIDRYKNFVAENKIDAAANELLNWYRQQKQQGSDVSYEFKNLKIKDEVKNQMIALADPGKSESVTKRLEYVDICSLLDHNDQALTVLRKLADERPFDDKIKIQLAFSLPVSEIDKAAELLKSTADSQELHQAVSKCYQRFSRNSDKDTDAILNYFEILSRYFESTDNINFNIYAEQEINTHIQYFASGNISQYLPSLINDQNREPKETPLAKRHHEVAKRLAFAMTNHSAFSEQGFRILLSAKWIEDEKQIDEMARKSILLQAQNSTSRSRHQSNISEHSSVSWLCDRLKSAKSFNEIFPDDYVKSLEKVDPSLPILLEALYSVKSVKEIESLWESGAMEMSINNNNDIRSNIQKAVLNKISTTKGSSDFFVSRIKSLNPEDLFSSSRHGGQSKQIPLMRAAIESCKYQDRQNIRNICDAIIDCVYGKNRSADRIANNYNANSLIQSLFSQYSADAKTAICIFQAFDSNKIPMDNYYWMQNAIQQEKLQKPEDAIKFLKSSGFFEDALNWRPLAYYSIKSESSNFGTSRYYLYRTNLTQVILSSFDYRLRNSDFVDALKAHQPQTFGSLMTAATFTSNPFERQELARKAFEISARQIAKASPEQIDNLSLVVDYLPYDSISILPKSLQTKISESRKKKIADIKKQIDNQFSYISQNPGQNPFGSLESYIEQMACLDLDSAIEVFKKCEAIFIANLPYYNPNQGNSHEYALHSITQSLSSSTESRPEIALKFYKAVRNRPEGKIYGICYKGYSSTYLENIGSSIQSRANSNSDNKIPSWIRPWLVIQKFPKETESEAIAATLCYAISQRYMPSKNENADEIIKSYSFSAKANEFLRACISLDHLNANTPEQRMPGEESLMKIIEDPMFDDEAKTQILFTAMGKYPKLLQSQAVAEKFCKYFSRYCDRDFSSVNYITINIISSIATLDQIENSKIHLKQINEAFWKNANSPKTGEHAEINETNIQNLFLASIKVGDEKNAELLLPNARSIISGDLYIITKLIQIDQFKLADELLANDLSDYKFSRSIQLLGNDLKQKLSKFLVSSGNPERAFRYECNLLRSLSGNSSSPTTDNIRELRNELIAHYQKTPPKDPKTRIEALSYFITNSTKLDDSMKKEICDIASIIDVKKTVYEWFDKYSTNYDSRLGEQYTFRLLCSASMIQFLEGNPDLFISICNTLADLLNRTSESESSKLQPFIKPFIEPALITTLQAVSEGNTKSFEKIIPPLEKLLMEISKETNLSSNDFAYTFAIYDFISQWENQPANCENLIKKMNLEEDHYIISTFAYPRQHFPLLNYYCQINQNNNLPRYGDNPIKLATSILSHESISSSFVVTFSWLDTMSYYDLKEQVKTLILNPPDSISKSGKLFLKYHELTEYITSYPDKVPAYREFLKEVPNTPEWYELTINSKLHLVYAMGRVKEVTLAERQAVFDSMDSKNIPESNKDFYERMLKEVRNAAAGTEE